MAIDIDDYKIIITTRFSDIACFLRQYSSFMDYRQIFMSKEWIQSYCAIYRPTEIVFIRNNSTFEYIVFEKSGDRLFCLGDPLNDFNMSELLYEEEFKKWINILSTDEKVKAHNVVLNCLTTSIDNCASDMLFCGLKTNLVKSQCRKISPKYIKMQKRYGDTIIYNRISPRESNFCTVLNLLLSQRKVVLLKKADDNNRFSLDIRFDSFIRFLCAQHSIQENIFIDYGIVKERIVSIVLSFINNGGALYYLRWCLRTTNRISYGPLLDLWSINQCKLNGINIVDFSRGNDSYKYRLGFDEYNIYNYDIILKEKAHNP